jgi:hypothetical protein
MPFKPEFPGELPTLGWAFLDWASTYLPSPRDEKSPLVFTDEQARLLLEWFRIDPRTGRFVYRRGCSRRSKGWGKGPLEAAKVLGELAGPVRFDGWDADGRPVARPWGFGGDPDPWVQIAAVTEDQTDNTYSVVNYFLTANDGRAADELRIDHGITRCYLRDRQGRIEPVTTSAPAREGQPLTYGAIDESHLLKMRNGGVKLARTIRRNVAKMDGRSYETTNAFEPGGGSVAEDTHKAATAGSPGIFYDAVEAPEVRQEDSDETLRKALAVAYGDAHWVNLDRLVKDIRDPDYPWEDSRRFFFNHNVAGHGKAVDPEMWDRLADPREVPHGTRIGLGFDGSISQDATILRGCTADGYSFILGKWIRPLGPKGMKWKVPRLLVDEAVREAFATYDVGRMLADPPKWWTEIESWAAEFGDERVLAFDTNKDGRMAPAVDRWLTALREGTHTHDGDEATTSHVKNAHLRKTKQKADDDDSRTLYTLTKGEEGGKIDAAVADVLAYEAAMTMPAAAEPTKPLVPLVAWT